MCTCVCVRDMRWYSREGEWRVAVNRGGGGAEWRYDCFRKGVHERKRECERNKENVACRVHSVLLVLFYSL